MQYSKYVFIYFVIIIYIITLGDGWMVKVLGYRQGVENSNFTQTKLCCDIITMICIVQFVKFKKTNNKLKKLTLKS